MASKRALVVGGILLLASTTCFCAPYSHFVEYQGGGGFTLYGSSVKVTFQANFSFNGEYFDNIKVQKDGRLVLGSSLNGTELTLDVFHTGYFPNGGSVHYRFYTEDVEGELGDVLDIIEGKSEIADNIIPNWATVVTWNNLTNYNQKSNTFQAVLMTDQNTSGSYVVYNYGAIEWPEDAGESTCSAGYKLGGEIWYTIPGSQVEDAVTITNTTNINEPGIWFFKVDKPETSLTSEADSFFLAFGPTFSSTPINLYILVSTNEEDDLSFSVEAPGINFIADGTTRRGQHAKVSIPSSALVQGSDTNKGIHIYTIKGHTIAVVAVAESEEHVARYSVLHQKNVKQNYTFYAATADDFLTYSTFAIVVATDDDTTINIRAPVTLTVGEQILNTNEEMEVVMEKYGTLLIHSRRDITGMKVTSNDKAIVFFTGHSCTNIPSDYGPCDSIIEQLPSTNDWGKEFMVSPLKYKMFTQLQILASVSNTTVHLKCINSGGRTTVSKYYTLSAGFPVIRHIQEHEVCHLKSSKPILAIQYVVSREADENDYDGGPAMMVIPSTSQYTAVTLIPAINETFEHYISIFVPAEYYQPEIIHLNETLTLVEVEHTVLVYYNNYTITYYICQIALPEGDYVIYSLQEDAKLGVIAYSYSSDYSFGYLASIKSSGSHYDTPLVKVIGNSNYGLCINTTYRGPVYWRDDFGSVVSSDRLLQVNNSNDGIQYWCEVPTYGNEPQNYYRQKFIPSGVVVIDESDGEKKDCAFNVKVFPRKVVASVLTNITLYCLTSEENIKSITWYYNKTEEVIGSRLVLTLEDATVEQSGTYTCLVIRKSGESASNISTVVIKNNYPVISEHPHDVHLVLNDTKVLLRLNCRADVMGGEIRWERDEGVISEDTIIEQHGDLIMTNPKLEDAGFYRCIAINGSGYTYSSYAHVTFDVQPPVIKIGPKNQTILVNDTVTLDCLATGYGNIGYQWIKSSMGVTDITDSYLVIEDTDGDGAGEYSCVATNVGGLTTSVPAFVRVLKPGIDNIVDKEISVYTSPHQLIAFEGTEARFTCYGVHGAGNYSYLWLNSFDEVVSNESLLVMPRVTEELSGNYTCTVIDGKGEVVTGYVELTVANRTLTMVTHVCDVALNISDRLKNAAFHCEANIQGVNYTWEKENGSITSRAIGVNMSTLVIPNIAVADAGKYRCIAYDRYGQVEVSEYACLNITVNPPTIKYQPDNITTTLGGNISMTCVAEGYAPLTYVWEKRGIGVIQNVTSPRLVLTNVTESMEGFYRCKVLNNYQGSVFSEYGRVTVRIAQVLNVTDCSTKNTSTMLQLRDIKTPSYLTNENLLLHGPLFSTSTQISKDVQSLIDSMVYICHHLNNTSPQLTMGIVIEPMWVITVAPYCEESCEIQKIEIVPLKNVPHDTNLTDICRQNYGRDKTVQINNMEYMYKSPNNDSVLLINVEKFFLKMFITKDTLMSRGILLKLQAGNAISLLGVSTSNQKAMSPMKYRYRIRSKLPPPNSSPPATVPDHCSQDLPPSCQWIPGSPIIYQPPRSTKYALLGIVAPQKICEVFEVYENHLNLSKDLEWIDQTVF